MSTNINISMRYSTFLPMLLEAMDRTRGDVLELGAGVFSTPILHWMCERHNRQLLTLESDRRWFHLTKHQLKNDNHKFVHIENWDKAEDLINKEWDVVLVDHSPSNRRIVEIKKLANLAKYLIVHDAEPWKEKEFRYSEIYPLFKYKFHFDLVDHHTVVLSNFANLADFSPYHGKPTELCELAMKYNSDKCPQIGHCYTPFYYEYLKDKRNSVKKVLEIGVGTNHYKKLIPGYVLGAGLRMWRDFFPNAHVYGIDIMPESIFTDDRLTTLHCDERDEQAVKNLISKIGSDIDLVIDDGSHHVNDQIFLLKTLMPLLDKGVTYIIEDCLRTRLIRNLFPEYDSFIPVLPPNKKHIRGGLIVFSQK